MRNSVQIDVLKNASASVGPHEERNQPDNGGGDGDPPQHVDGETSTKQNYSENGEKNQCEHPSLPSETVINPYPLRGSKTASMLDFPKYWV